MKVHGSLCFLSSGHFCQTLPGFVFPFFFGKETFTGGEKEIKEIYAYIAYPNKRKDVLHMFSHYEFSILTFLILVSRGGSFP